MHNGVTVRGVDELWIVEIARLIELVHP
jgi:hypothetical protein